jgi:hypothetical protein
MATLILNPDSETPRLIHLDKSSTLIGKASDADVVLDSDVPADHHARIKSKEDGLYLINLQGDSNVCVNGKDIISHKLQHGDRIKIGDVDAVVMLSKADAPQQPPVAEPVSAEPMPEMMPVRRTTAYMTTEPPVECPHCGYPVPGHLRACPQCGLTINSHALAPLGLINPTPIGQSGPGILPVIAFLAALSIIGAPAALVLGLMCLAIIRRKGGTVRDQKLAYWSIGLGLFWLMAGGVAITRVAQRAHQDDQERQRSAAHNKNEANVIRALKNLACAQRFAHTVEFFDTDQDGRGEYGTLDELPEMKSSFFDVTIADGEEYGYRFRIDEALEGRFLAVAEPMIYNETGIRTFAIDQTGQIRGADIDGQQITTVLPTLAEESAFYEMDDDIAKDVVNYLKLLPKELEAQKKQRRILQRLRTEYSLTTVGQQLQGLEKAVDKDITELQATVIYQDAKIALAEGEQDVALAKLQEITDRHPSFSMIASVEREIDNLRSEIARKREQLAQELLDKAEKMERENGHPKEIEQLYQQIEKLYPETDVSARIVELKPELQRQLRERNTEDIFSELMELSPETEFETILNLANQLHRNYNDTIMYGKISAELNKKERKARANDWRAKTVENMEQGRMRGALAQIESAAKENPDLIYDLRELFIELYRHVAEQLMNEGDARSALVYYTRLDQLLKKSNSSETLDKDLLAKLHHDVGQADYERNNFQGARWHLSNAAWKYQGDAPFNVRLGAACLYSGLYQPAENALNQALTTQPDMEPALLYRAYMNLRVLLVYENTIADCFSDMDIETQDDEPGSEQAASNQDEGEDDEYVDTEDPMSFEMVAFQENNTTIPKPTDLDLLIRYDHKSSRGILPNILTFVQDVQDTAEAYGEELKAAYGDAEKLASVRMGHLTDIADLRNELSDLRKLHLEDLKAQRKLCDMIAAMKVRAETAQSDIKIASANQPNIQTLSQEILSELDRKCVGLFTATDLIKKNVETDIKMREQIFAIAEKAVRNTSSSIASTSSDVSRFIRSLIRRTNTNADVDVALLSLQDSMEVQIDLEDLIQAAEGRSEQGPSY